MANISVIVPAYNAEKTLRATLLSALHQTYRDIEVVVVDDGSTDQTAAIVQTLQQGDARIRLLQNETNRGVLFTRRRGAEESNAPWLAFLDADDLWEEEKLAKQIALAEREGVSLVYTASAFIDEGGTPLSYVFHVPQTVTYRTLLKQNVISNSSVLIKKEAFFSSSVAGKDMHEDFAVWLTHLKNGGAARGIDEPLLVYRLSDKSKSGNKRHAAMMNWRTYRAIGLPFLSSLYYEICYAVRGVRKYRNLRKAKKRPNGETDNG